MPSKIEIPLNGQMVDIDPARVLTNNVILPDEYNPHNVGLFVIFGAYGVLGAVWATSEGDALDELVDADLAGALLIEEEDADEEDQPRAGNASEPVDLTYCAIERVTFDPARDWKLLCRFAEARGAAADDLSH